MRYQEQDPAHPPALLSLTALLQAIGFFGGFTMFDVTLSMLRELGVRVHANPRCIGSMLWTQGPCSGHRVHAVDVKSTLILGSMLTLNPMQRGSRSHACYMSRLPQPQRPTPLAVTSAPSPAQTAAVMSSRRSCSPSSSSRSGTTSPPGTSSPSSGEGSR